MERDVTKRGATPPERLANILPTVEPGCTALVTETTPERHQKASPPPALKVIDGGTVEGRDNALLTSIARLSGSMPEEIRRNSYDDYGFESQLIGYRLGAPVTAATQQQIRTMIAQANPPLDEKKVIPRLHAMAKAMPSQDGSDGEAWGELVLMALDDVSADVVIEALNRMVKREKWRPTPAEIRDDCLWLSRKRRALQRLEIAG